jgi:stearoyl-CoA desaturase (delta-9 desaturase)
VSQTLQTKSAKPPYDIPITIFLIAVPVAALILTPLYCYFEKVSWQLLLFTLIFAAATNLSITAGYHRLFSHRSYEAHFLVRLIYLLIGSSAFQGSALKWSADHRRHHNRVDTDEDPYSINKGFWYAHMGWLFEKDPEGWQPKAADLEKDWMIRFQHRFYNPLAVLMGFGLPTFVGYLMNAPMGGFIFAGLLRVALTQQSTFFVNSLCHTLGRKTYSEEVSARDSVIVAILTHGEGYHNFHHHFQADYRNGIKWYQWDPTKWTILTFYFMGLASKLRTISPVEILKARLHAEATKMQRLGHSMEVTQSLREKMLNAQITYRKLKADYCRLKKELQTSSHEKLVMLKVEMRKQKREFKTSMKLWRAYLRNRRQSA